MDTVRQCRQFFSPPGRYAAATWRAIYSAAVFNFLYIFIFNDSCQTNYLKTYGTDLHEICTVVRTMAVDDLSEISFSIPEATLPRHRVFVGFIHRTEFR